MELKRSKYWLSIFIFSQWHLTKVKTTALYKNRRRRKSLKTSSVIICLDLNFFVEICGFKTYMYIYEWFNRFFYVSFRNCWLWPNFHHPWSAHINHCGLPNLCFALKSMDFTLQMYVANYPTYYLTTFHNVPHKKLTTCIHHDPRKRVERQYKQIPRL